MVGVEVDWSICRQSRECCCYCCHHFCHTCHPSQNLGQTHTMNIQNSKNTKLQIHKHKDQHKEQANNQYTETVEDNQKGVYLPLSLLAAFEGKQVDDESFDWRSDAG